MDLSASETYDNADDRDHFHDHMNQVIIKVQAIFMVFDEMAKKISTLLP